MKPLKTEFVHYLIIFLAGAALPLAFAPFGFYPLAVLSLIPLFVLWIRASAAQAAVGGFLFGLGQFGVGVSWVYVAIHVFGHTPLPLAVVMTLLFVSVLASIPALVGYLVVRFYREGNRESVYFIALWMPALWVLGEWLRGWLFTGFPWLNLGYSTIDAPVRGFAPLVGVYGLSLIMALGAGALLWLWWSRFKGVTPVLLLLVVWAGGAWLDRVEWGEAAGEPLRVSLIQGNVPQSTKWDPERIHNRLTTYADLSRDNFSSSDLIVWPENAITVFYSTIAENYFDPLTEEARLTQTDLILGVPLLAEDNVGYYTTMMSLGSHHGFYRKRHLVPFGEFLPMDGLLRGLIDFFNMPMSNFSRGSDEQPLLEVAGHKVAASVCYEDAFGEEVIDFLPQATMLVNGSNNAWYGDSLAPHQHLQISRMRALETARPMLRATTNGISALINHRGEIEKRSAQFRQEVVRGQVLPRSGVTPYVMWGNWPVVILALLIVAWGRFRQG